jgi:hypothetical protein
MRMRSAPPCISKLKAVLRPALQGSSQCSDQAAYIARKSRTWREAKKCLELLQQMDSVLGICVFEEEGVPQEIQELIQARLVARKEKNWKLSDETRERILQLGYLVEDTPQGSRAKRHTSIIMELRSKEKIDSKGTITRTASLEDIFVLQQVVSQFSYSLLFNKEIKTKRDVWIGLLLDLGMLSSLEHMLMQVVDKSNIDFYEREVKEHFKTRNLNIKEAEKIVARVFCKTPAMTNFSGYVYTS